MNTENKIDFSQLKAECANKLRTANEMYFELCIKILSKDLDNLSINKPERVKKISDKKYLLDKLIKMSIREDGWLDVIDDRATAYGWLFGLYFEAEFVLGDAIVHDRHVYFVKDMNEHDFEGCVEEVQKIVIGVDNTIGELKSLLDKDNWNYKYTDQDEEKLYNDINAVLEEILNREPIYY